MAIPNIEQTALYKKFRVFFSSTFQDFKAERNALQKMVFSKLREFCRNKGSAFEPIDLRWGIDKSMSETHEIL